MDFFIKIFLTVKILNCYVGAATFSLLWLVENISIKASAVLLQFTENTSAVVRVNRAALA